MINLSIIIPHYNSVNLLEKLLNSIPVDNSIQIVVVDDKSCEEETLKLKELLSNHGHHHLNFLNNTTSKKGAGVCRNIGLNVAKGEWILFADADDHFLDGFYESISRYFDADYDVVFFTPTSVELDTGEKSDRHLKYENLIKNYSIMDNKETETLLKYKFFVPWSKLIKKELIMNNDIKFDEVIASNDVMFSTKLGYYLKKFKVSQENIYCVTRRKGTLTTNISQQNFDARLKVHIDYYKFLTTHLEKKELKLVNVTGIGPLINAFKYKLGFKKIMSIFIKLKKNKIKIFSLKYANPIFVSRKIIEQYKMQMKVKKYIS